MARFLQTLILLSLAGTILGTLLVLLRRCLGRRLSNGFFYLAWLLVLLRLVIPVPGLLPLPRAEEAPERASAFSTPAEDEGERNTHRADLPAEWPMLEGRIGTPDHALVQNAAQSAPGDTQRSVARQPSSPTASGKGSVDWTLLLFALWAVGALLSAGWYLLGYARFRLALRPQLRPAEPALWETAGLPRTGSHPRLLRCAVLRTPLLLGLLRPAILLPEQDYRPEELRGILRHELLHYRRGDLAVKWFAAGVFSLHWFNPLMLLFRAELDRCCELSCDERLLRTMEAEERREYGELLLRLAVSRALPRRMVAVSFATEKRNLKERLVQIMTYRKKGPWTWVLMLTALALLAGCAVAMGPGAQPGESPEVPAAKVTETLPTAAPETDTPQETMEEPANEPDQPDETDVVLPNVAVVHNADEFLAALDSDTVIVLEEGVYNLTFANAYGQNSERYSWSDVGDGLELHIRNLDNLTISGGGTAEEVSLVTEPRYANVLYFDGCENISLSGLTVGHTPEDGYCTGGVIMLSGCHSVNIEDCVLYGCGTVGIQAENCWKVFARGTTVKECSYGAVWAENSFDLRFEAGEIYDCGNKDDSGAMNLLYASTTTGFAVLNTEFYGSSAESLLRSDHSAGVIVRGCRVHDNSLHGFFHAAGPSPAVGDCAFADNTYDQWCYNYDGETPCFAVDLSGETLTEESFLAMEYAPWTGEYTGPVLPETEKPEGTPLPDGRTEYRVETVDEFLACIGSDTVIVLDGSLFDLTTASLYGGYGGTNYYWSATVDGPSLVITGVERLTIRGLGKDATSIENLPRYADVLAFADCLEVSIEDLTAGHTRGQGYCEGDVLSFWYCADCKVSGCGLFGCGVNGIRADFCQNLAVEDTEIYECNLNAAILRSCFNTVFTDCDVHDCGENSVLIFGDHALTTLWNGETPEENPDMLQMN